MKIEVIIQKILPDGKHGPFAVAVSESIKGSITFSLKEPVWREKRWPESGDVVVIWDVRKKRAGWRADKGRFFRPSDEKKRENS